MTERKVATHRGELHFGLRLGERVKSTAAGVHYPWMNPTVPPSLTPTPGSRRTPPAMPTFGLADSNRRNADRRED